MNGVELKTASNNKELIVTFEPLLLESAVLPKALLQMARASLFCDFYMSEESVIAACDKLKRALSNNKMEPIEAVLGIAKDAEIAITIADDKMSAELTITAPYNGSVPNVLELRQLLNDASVCRGISDKRLLSLVNLANQAEPGEPFSHIIAKGLPPRAGKDSYIKTLVPNALERVLAPKESDGNKVDMRDFGALLSVKRNQVVAKRMAPSEGRHGFTVTGELIPAQTGEWKKIKLGDNVFIPEGQKNQIFAKLSGLPKYLNGQISVDTVYSVDGVNVATGNIKYSGAVIVNGDVTENMKIVASGDVTINGFVESAYIESGGNIIITKGATGKMQDIDCQLIAAGSIFLEHGQGLHLTSGKQINIVKQLAHSNVKCNGNLVVGNVQNPRGKLFASTVSCSKSVIAGSIGAVSGSSLSIDYSDAFNQLCDRFDSINKLFKDLSTKNANHEVKVAEVNAQITSGPHVDKVAQLNKELELERIFLNWLRISKEELKQEINDYKSSARVIATEALFPGVSVKLNKTTWSAQKEYDRCSVNLTNGKWTYIPTV